MKQKQLASSAGISIQQLRKHETAGIRVSASALCKIANCLNLPPSAFFADLTEVDGDANTPSDAPHLAYLTTVEGRHLIDDLISLSPHARRRVAAFIAGLLEEDDEDPNVSGNEPGKGSLH